MAIYTKEKEKNISGNSSLISVPKTYELCALTVEFTKSRFLADVGCYGHPASKHRIQNLPKIAYT